MQRPLPGGPRCVHSVSPSGGHGVLNGIRSRLDIHFGNDEAGQLFILIHIVPIKQPKTGFSILTSIVWFGSGNVLYFFNGAIIFVQTQHNFLSKNDFGLQLCVCMNVILNYMFTLSACLERSDREASGTAACSFLKKPLLQTTSHWTHRMSSGPQQYTCQVWSPSDEWLVRKSKDGHTYIQTLIILWFTIIMC